MKQSRRRIRVVIPTLVIGIAVVASCWSAGVLARKERVHGARASLPSMSAKRKQVDERAAHALRAAMPALQSLAFEANDGQADAAVRFIARGRGHQLLLTSRSV